MLQQLADLYTHLNEIEDSEKFRKIISLGLNVTFTRRIEYQANPPGFTTTYLLSCEDPAVIVSSEVPGKCAELFLDEIEPCRFRYPPLRLVPKFSASPASRD